MLYGKRWSSMLPEAMRIAFTNSDGASLILCGGQIPSDAVMTGLTSSSSVITSAKLATIATSGMTFALMSTTEQPPLFEMSAPPTTRSVAATAAGTITWAVLSGTYCLWLLDVSLPNQGGSVQLDKTTVSVGTIVSLMGISYSIWR